MSELSNPLNDPLYAKSGSTASTFANGMRVVSPPSTDDEGSPSDLETKPSWHTLNRLTLGAERVNLDDDDVDIVFVFPRQVEPSMVADPSLRASEIFPNLDLDAEACSVLGRPSMPVEEYQKFVRDEIGRRLAEAGFHLDSFLSIDRDEAFLKIGLDRSGELIKHLAQQFQYAMPFKRKAYRGFSSELIVDKDIHGCPINENMQIAPAYQPFHTDFQEYHTPFTDVDGKRIAMRRIRQLMSLPQLSHQGVLLFHFVAADHNQMEKLGAELCGVKNMMTMPKLSDANQLREYFGEQVAFCFQWNAYFVRMLAPIAGSVLMVRLGTIYYMPSHLQTDCCRLFYMVVCILWAQHYNRQYARIARRSVQKWGMKDYETFRSISLESHDPTLDRTRRLHIQQGFVSVCSVLFCVTFVGLIVWSEGFLPENRQAMMTVVLIRLGYPMWSAICRHLVKLQNHRTEQEYIDSLTYLLCGVKIFCSLFPFLHQAFIVRFSVTCGSDWATVVNKVYNKTGEKVLPDIRLVGGASYTNITGILSSGDDAFSWVTEGGVCISGCYPTRCNVWLKDDGTEGFDCTTNCWDQMQHNFEILYASHLALTIIFLLVPRVITLAVWKLELLQARLARKAKQHHHRHEKLSSFLQMQSKHHRHAEYAFLSWGGSVVEDFLELILSFTLLVCFGMVYPTLAVFAFLCHAIEYRLLIGRMIFITSRPFPLGAEGIGKFEEILNACVSLAVLINVGLALCFLDPVRHFKMETKVFLFLVIEHLLFFLKQMAHHWIDRVPKDSQAIEVYNNEFLAWMRSKEAFEVPEPERQCAMGIDIDLGALSSDSEDAL